MTFRVVDERGAHARRGQGPGRAEASGWRPRCGPRSSARGRRSRAAGAAHLDDFGDAAAGRSSRSGGHAVKAYPALVDEGDSVAVRVFETEAEQREAMWAGTRRLLLLNVAARRPSPSCGGLDNQAKLGAEPQPARQRRRAARRLRATCAVDKLITDAGGPAWDEDGFAPSSTTRVPGRAARHHWRRSCRRVARSSPSARGRRPAQAHEQPAVLRLLTDIRAQLSALVFPGFVTADRRRPAARPAALPARDRAPPGRLRRRPHRDHERMLQLDASRLPTRRRTLARDAAPRVASARRGDSAEIRWMIEELRVSFFAQELGTPRRSPTNAS